jgi:taurine dioxygenase
MTDHSLNKAESNHEEIFTVLPSNAPLGNEIIGLDLSKVLHPATFTRLSQAFVDHSVLVFRDQKLTPDEQIRFSKGFGELEVHVLEKYLLPGYPEVFRVSNIMENGQRIGGSGEFWHTDLSYVKRPSRGSLLYSIEVPTRDGVVLGDTEFGSTAAAFEALPEPLKKKLRGLKAVHRFGDIYSKIKKARNETPELTTEQKAKTPDVVHPVVLKHPLSGRESIFVNEGFTSHIIGMPEDESRDLLAQLYAHCTKPEFIYVHKWRAGDLIMWDNWATVHRATGGYTPEERRLLHRTTLTASMSLY